MTTRARGGAGTRGGVGRLAAMAVGLAVVLALALAGEARAGTYEVAQCGWGVGAELDPSLPATEGVGAYLRPVNCTSPPPGAGQGLAFLTGMANKGEAVLARARWAAPPGTGIAAARFLWSGQLMSGFWQTAGIDTGGEFRGLAYMDQSAGPQPVALTVAGPARAFEVRLECAFNGSAIGCDRSYLSQMAMNYLTLTIVDPVPPSAQAGGALAAPGWHRGTVPLEVSGEDAVGAGVYREEATLDGEPALVSPAACAVAVIEGQVRATRLQPCPQKSAGASEVDTAGLADGAHALRACVVDFGGAEGCAPTVRVEVDNSPPAVEFAAAPDGQVVATVGDAFSGPAAGSIAMRRASSESWTDLPTTFEGGTGAAATLRAQLPDLAGGAFFFRATASDRAGNTGSAQFRASGSPTEIRGQLGGADAGHGPAGRGGRAGARANGRTTHLVAHLSGPARGRRRGRDATTTVAFGTAVGIRGRLIDAHGDGVARRRVTVVARSTAGGGGPADRRSVVTDRAGRFALELPPKVSRRVDISFGGGDGYAPSRARSLLVRVRAAVSLTAEPTRLRTGATVRLSGVVRPGIARIPSRGKLVTIQYLERASRRWRPALVVRTGARGRFKARYRFRYITGSARIRLRATALPEAGWPYAAGSSAPVTLEVHG
jgi:hypothetical protein